MLTAEEVYGTLMGAPSASSCDAFDRHAVAAIVSLALAEAEATGVPPCAGLGLGRADLLALAEELFPERVGLLGTLVPAGEVEVDEEERNVRDILGLYASGAGRLQRALIALIARRVRAPHHLWQDLGLRNRGELSELMGRHFAPLARKNSQDMKWKKFLYRMVCGTEGFTLCTAPVCSECEDFANCFGAEDGESRLAVARNGGAAAAPAPAAIHAPDR